ncbi:hypothetical protein K0M31_008683 [Melipona bicolor]|uniref:RNase H type-1 domain-containing protein n=1 Tax=Melipona bicolor TaxID=60889 RepID=A0AA40KK63_9HYME|nr:hypothetical protein K0M31_008683 [Melipona bicolor]
MFACWDILPIKPGLTRWITKDIELPASGFSKLKDAVYCILSHQSSNVAYLLSYSVHFPQPSPRCAKPPPTKQAILINRGTLILWNHERKKKEKKEERRDHTAVSVGLVFAWIPSHPGIVGNEIANLNAKEALTLPLSESTDPYPIPRAYTLCKTNVKDEWNRLWTTSDRTKIHNVINDFYQEVPFGGLTKKERITLARLRTI